MQTGFVEGLQGYNAHFLFDTQFTNSLYSAPLNLKILMDWRIVNIYEQKSRR